MQVEYKNSNLFYGYRRIFYRIFSPTNKLQISVVYHKAFYLLTDLAVHLWVYNGKNDHKYISAYVSYHAFGFSGCPVVWHKDTLFFCTLQGLQSK